jgi:hypothetical protein
MRDLTFPTCRVGAAKAAAAAATGFADSGAVRCSATDGVDGGGVAFVARLPAIGAVTMLGAQPARTTINANG